MAFLGPLAGLLSETKERGPRAGRISLRYSLPGSSPSKPYPISMLFVGRASARRAGHGVASSLASGCKLPPPGAKSQNHLVEAQRCRCSLEDVTSMAAFSVSGASELVKRVLDESNKAWGRVFVGVCSHPSIPLCPTRSPAAQLRAPFRLSGCVPSQVPALPRAWSQWTPSFQRAGGHRTVA